MAFEPYSNRNYGGPGGQLPPLPTVEQMPVAYAPPTVRAAFLNKVYLSVCGGVAVSMATGFYVATQAPGLMSFFLGMGVIKFLLVLFGFMGLAFAVQAVARVPGLNVLAFGTFTAAVGAIILAPMFYFSIHTVGYQVIWNAFGLTALVFGGLTAFVLITGKDFSFLRGFLFVGILIFIAFMIGSFFLHSPVFHLAVTCGGLLLFSLFILYDTSMVMQAYTPDLWISAALSLFTDFVNLFIRMLSLLLQLGGGSSDD